MYYVDQDATEAMDELHEAELELRMRILSEWAENPEVKHSYEAVRTGGRLEDLMNAVCDDIVEGTGLTDEEAALIVSRVTVLAIVGDRIASIDEERDEILGQSLSPTHAES